MVVVVAVVEMGYSHHVVVRCWMFLNERERERESTFIYVGCAEGYGMKRMDQITYQEEKCVENNSFRIPQHK
jgi:hypothetical protein